MEAHALQPYERSLHEASTLELHAQDGTIIELDVAGWLAPPTAADRTVLHRCAGPTLDVGCGPGRFASALIERGVPALGVDIAPAAVELTRGRGTPALVRSVFERVPGAGRWPTILLVDGNIGIGGDPPRLLQRLRALLAPGGSLIVEADSKEDADERLRVRFSRNGVVAGPVFSWARVGPKALLDYALAAGFEPSESWTAGGRRFEVLRS